VAPGGGAIESAHGPAVDTALAGDGADAVERCPTVQRYVTDSSVD
jgi:hypothetical protein